MDEINGSRHLVNFRLLYSISHVIGFIIFILIASWVGIHLGGVGWSSNPGIQFNWHPILMTLGMILLYGNCKYLTNLLTLRVYDRKKVDYINVLCTFYSNFNLPWFPLCSQKTIEINACSHSCRCFFLHRNCIGGSF